MDDKRGGDKHGGPGDPDGVREWLLQLERRVSELEHERALTLRRRRRMFWYIALMAIAYLLMTTYILNLAGT